MTLPGARALTSWWRDLSATSGPGISPRRLWYAHLVLHRVEAFVELDLPPASTVLARGLLRFLAPSGSVTTATLATDLALRPDLLEALLTGLHKEGLIEIADGGKSCSLTQAGREVCGGQRPLAPTLRQERRVFYFADTRPPLYLPLSPQSATPLPSPGGWRFDLATLEGCLTKPVEWKHQNGFPAEVVRLIWPKAEVTEATWHVVPLDRPEQAHLLLAEGADGALTALPVQPSNWTLGREPAFVLAGGAEVLTTLTSEVAADAWRQAWLAWCQTRSLPASEVEACKLEPSGHKLHVKAPPRLVDRLRQAKSEALRGEAWLLAGSARVRPAAVIEISS